jgi:hypothetical protein
MNDFLSIFFGILVSYLNKERAFCCNPSLFLASSKAACTSSLSNGTGNIPPSLSIL